VIVISVMVDGDSAHAKIAWKLTSVSEFSTFSWCMDQPRYIDVAGTEPGIQTMGGNACWARRWDGMGWEGCVVDDQMRSSGSVPKFGTDGLVEMRVVPLIDAAYGRTVGCHRRRKMTSPSAAA